MQNMQKKAETIEKEQNEKELRNKCSRLALETILQHNVVSHPHFTFFWGSSILFRYPDRYPLFGLISLCNLEKLDIDSFEKDYLEVSYESKVSYVAHLEEHFKPSSAFRDNTVVWVYPDRTKDYRDALWLTIYPDVRKLFPGMKKMDEVNKDEYIFKYFIAQTILVDYYRFGELYRSFVGFLSALPEAELPEAKKADPRYKEVETRALLWDAFENRKDN